MKQVRWNQPFHRPAVFTASVMMLVGWILPTDLLAVPITYTEQTVTDGSLDGTAYSLKSTTITFVGDTGNVTSIGGTFSNAIGTVSVTVTGVGTDTFTDSMEVLVGQGVMLAGIRDVTLNTDVIVTFGGISFSTYDLTTAIGPITGATVIISLNTAFGTSGGNLIFTREGVATSIFTATLTGAVPEPTSLSLFGLGLVGLATLRRKFSQS